MLFFDRRNAQDRRKEKERRELRGPDYDGTDRRAGNDRRHTRDRRSGHDRRTGAYYNLPEEKRGVVDRIIDMVEHHIEMEKQGLQADQD